MSTLFIDADACPVKSEAISVAKARGLPVVLVCNVSQDMSRFASRRGIETVQVSSGRDAADFAIVERLREGDVVVTQDIGLAAMALGRSAAAISPRGRLFSRANIDAELEVRHAEQRLRRSGGRTRGPSPFDEDDREHFVSSLERLLADLLGSGS